MDKIIKNCFGPLIKAYRERLRMNVLEFAAKTGVSPRTITRLEQGQETVGRGTAAMIGKYLGYSAVWEFQLAAKYYDRRQQIMLPEMLPPAKEETLHIRSIRKRSFWSKLFPKRRFAV